MKINRKKLKYFGIGFGLVATGYVVFIGYKMYDSCKSSNRVGVAFANPFKKIDL